jgi:hypothetical protein
MCFTYRRAACLLLLLLLANCAGAGTNLTPQRAPAVPGASSAGAMFETEALAAPKYTAEQCPLTPSAMMRDGQIPGADGNDAAVYDDGHLRNLGKYDGLPSAASWVNASGDAVGTVFDASNDSFHAILFNSDGAHDLGELPPGPNGPNTDSGADVIDNGGEIYGFSSPAGLEGGPQLVRFSLSAPPVPLQPDSTSTPLTSYGTITDINDSGHFSVLSDISPPIGPFAATGFGDELTFMFGEHASASTGINDTDVITGYYDPINEPEDNLSRWTPFIKDKTGVHVLPRLSGANSVQPAGINDDGDVVGSSATYNSEGNRVGTPTVFLYTGGHVYDVEKLLSLSFGTTFTVLSGISNAGSFIVESASTGKCYLLKRTSGT